ncbi:MAG: tetratricopeptide repeat protein [Planctomycetia bacterium]
MDSRKTNNRSADPVAAAAGVATLLVAAVVCAAYAPAMRGEFLFDDLSEIVTNPAVRTVWPPTRSMFSGGELPHRPLPYFTFAVNHALGGLEPFGYHVFNVVVHLANGWLLWWVVSWTLARRGMGRPDAEPRADAGTVAAIAAAVWLLHPIQTEAVSYVYQRIEVLAATAAFGTLATFLAAVDAEGTRQRLLVAASVACAAAGMACKEWFVVVPPLILLFDLLVVGGPWRQVLVRRGWWHAALAATWLVLAAVVVSQRGLYSEFAADASGLQHRHLYLVNQPAVILWYLTLLVVPVGQSLDHGMPLATGWWLAAPCLVLAGALAACLIAFRRHAAAAWLGLAFFLLLAPTSSIQPVHDACVEHRMYLPSAPLAVAFACGLAGVCGRRGWGRGPQVGLAIGICAARAVVTFNRNAIYATPRAAWADAVAKSPPSSRARARLATERSRDQQHDEAIAIAREAVALRPTGTVEHAALAAALLNAGRDAEAAAVCRQGLAAAGGPGGWRDPVARRREIYLGMALDRGGDPAGRRLLAEAVRADPDSLVAREQLARALVRDEPRQAAELYRQLVSVTPRDPQLRYDLGCALAAFAPAEAEEAFRAAIGLDPENADAHNNLAGLLFAASRLDEAIAAYRACLRIRPDHPLAGQNLAAAEAARARAGD